MKSAGEFLAEAQRLRDLARNCTDQRLFEAIQELVDELEARARELENGA